MFSTPICGILCGQKVTYIQEGDIVNIRMYWKSCTDWRWSGRPGLLGMIQSSTRTLQKHRPSTETAKFMRSYHTNGTYSRGGYASMSSSRIFGGQTNPCRQMEDLTQIRPGDVIFRVSNTTGRIWHVIVALESPSGLHSYHVTDGSHDGIVFWTDQESQYGGENPVCNGEDKNHRLEVWTRYLESVS